MTCPGYVGVPNGANAPVVAVSLGSAVSVLLVTKFCPVSVIFLAGTSCTFGSFGSHPIIASSSPTTPLFVAEPIPT